MAPRKTDATGKGSGSPDYAVKYGRTEIPLADTIFRIGRGVDCELSLAGVNVSRHHAQLVLRDGDVVVEDTGSANGVYVNGTRIIGEQRLAVGDKVKIGDHVLELRTAGWQPMRSNYSVTSDELSQSSVDTLVDVVPVRANPAPADGPARPLPPSAVVRQAAQAGEDDSSKRRRVAVGAKPGSAARRIRKPTPPPRIPVLQSDEGLPVVASLPDDEEVQRAIDTGRVEEAEHQLIPFLAGLRGHVTDGTRVDPDLAERAGVLAAKLAVATGKRAWADYPVWIYSGLRKPLPASVVAEMSIALQKLGGLDLERLERYLEKLRLSELEPAEREMIQLTETLLEMAQEMAKS